MAKDKKSAAQTPDRKNFVGMAAVALLCILFGFMALRFGVFDPQVNQVAEVDKNGKSASSDSDSQDKKTTNTAGASSDKPATANTDPVKSDIKPDNAPLTPEDFTPLSVYHEDTQAGYTAVFNRRGASLAVLRFTDERDGKVKPLFVSTPRSPMERPAKELEQDALLLLGPPRSLRPIKWDAQKDGWVKKDPSTDHFTAFPERAGPSFDVIWNTKRDGVSSPRVFNSAFNLIGGDQSLNTHRWKLLESKFSEDETFIAYQAEAGDLRYTKRFTLLPDFKIVCDLSIENTGAKDLSRDLSLYGPVGVRQDVIDSYTRNVTALFASPSGRSYYSDEELFGALSSELEDYNEEKGKAESSITMPVDVLYGREEEKAEHVMMNGISNGYFLAAIGIDYLPEAYYGDDWQGRAGGDLILSGLSSGEELDEPNLHATYSFPTLSIPVGETKSRRVVLYAGPRDKEHVEAGFAIGERENLAESTSWSEYVSTGWPEFISQPITLLLRLLRSWVGSMGLAILALTILVRMLMSPLSVRGQLKMQVHAFKMKQIKPKLDELNKKYEYRQSRDDKMLKFREQQAIMKANGVSLLPLGGCLPLLLQMPIFLALYNSVRTSFLLRHETFLWMNDLSRPDALLGAWEHGIGLLGFLSNEGFLTLNILPIMWAGMLVVQQMVGATTPTDPNQARMQKQMRFIMPLMGVMFYAMPAGFTLYFVMSSIYSFIEVRLVKLYLISKGIIDPPEKKGKPGEAKVTVEKTS